MDTAAPRAFFLDLQSRIVVLRSRASVNRPILGDHGLVWRGDVWVALVWSGDLASSGGENDVFVVPPWKHYAHTASKESLGGMEIWMKDGVSCKVMLWNGVPLAVEPPAHVELKIVETDPGVRGDTATGGQKPAKLETGAVVRVPLFINEGDIICINTQTGEYTERVEKSK